MKSNLQVTRDVQDICSRLSGNGLKGNFGLNENSVLFLKEWVVLNPDFTSLSFNYSASLSSCFGREMNFNYTSPTEQSCESSPKLDTSGECRCGQVVVSSFRSSLSCVCEHHKARRRTGHLRSPGGLSEGDFIWSFNSLLGLKAQQLRPLGPLVEEMDLCPSTHTLAHNCRFLELQFQGLQTPSSDSSGHQISTWNTTRHAGNTFLQMNIKRNEYKKKKKEGMQWTGEVKTFKTWKGKAWREEEQAAGDLQLATWFLCLLHPYLYPLLPLHPTPSPSIPSFPHSSLSLSSSSSLFPSCLSSFVMLGIRACTCYSGSIPLSHVSLVF